MAKDGFDSDTFSYSTDGWALILGALSRIYYLTVTLLSFLSFIRYERQLLSAVDRIYFYSQVVWKRGGCRMDRRARVS